MNRRTAVRLEFARAVESASVVSLMEDETYAELTPDGNALSLTVEPYEIVTLKLRLR